MRTFDHGGDTFDGKIVNLDFSVNTNPLGMPDSVKEAVIQNLETYVCYPDPLCRELRDKIADYHHIESNQVLCGNGAADLIFRICAYLKAKQALTLAPTFSEYLRPLLLFGGEMSAYRLREADGFTVQESFLNCLSGALDIVFFCNPNNPVGKLASNTLLQSAAEKCLQNGTLLMIDECFLPFTEGDSMIPFMKQYPNLLILRSFTKIFSLAGIRLGCLLCSDSDLLEKIASFGAAWSVSTVAQTAGIAALTESGWIRETQIYVKNERTFMTRALSEMGLKVFPSDANFLLIKSKIPLYEPLLKRGILVRACENFSGLDESFIRIGIKPHETNNALLSQIAEILRTVQL